MCLTHALVPLTGTRGSFIVVFSLLFGLRAGDGDGHWATTPLRLSRTP